MIPTCGRVSGHDQCPPDYHTEDVGLESATTGSFAGALVRVVGGYNPATRKWSRTRRSFQVFNGIELGWAHMAKDNAVAAMGAVYNAVPQAWGVPVTPAMVSSLMAAHAGKNAFDLAFGWASEGWANSVNTAAASNAYAQTWWVEIAAKAIDWAFKAKIQDKKTLALAVRMRNTSGTQLAKLKTAVEQLGEKGGFARAKAEYESSRGADLAGLDWPELQGTISAWPVPGDLRWSSIESPGVPGLTGQQSLRASVSSIPSVISYPLIVFGAFVVLRLLKVLK